MKVFFDRIFFALDVMQIADFERFFIAKSSYQARWKCIDSLFNPVKYKWQIICYRAPQKSKFNYSNDFSWKIPCFILIWALYWDWNWAIKCLKIGIPRYNFLNFRSMWQNFWEKPVPEKFHQEWAIFHQKLGFFTFLRSLIANHLSFFNAPNLSSLR